MSSMLRPTLLAAGLAALVVAVSAAAETSTWLAASAISSSTAISAPATGASRTPTAVKEFTDDELKSFAAASLRVEAIGSKWYPRISDAEDKAAEAILREQAMSEMVQAVQQKGLTVDRYNRIALAVQSDPDIARTVQTFRTERP